MSNEREDYDDGYDYDEKEYDYEEEDDYGEMRFQEEDYKEQEQHIAQFGFKDLLRIGGQEDEFLELPLGTEIDQIKLDPDLKFKLEIRDLLQKSTFGFDEKDKAMIKKSIRLLPFIQYKNPFLW